MRSRVEAAWGMRLLAGLCALILTLVLTVILLTVRDFLHEPNLQCSNGRESQVVVYVLVVGGMVVLASYVAFVVPLVLLWPVSAQRRHWYAVLGVAMLWPPFLYGVIVRREGLPALLRDVV